MLGSKKIWLSAWVSMICLSLGGAAEAGSLQIRALPIPAGAVDVNYLASTAEGGGLYGLDVEIVATGGLTIQSVTCDAPRCSYRLDSAQRLLVEGGEITGEGLGTPGAGSQLVDLVTLVVTGSTGTIEVETGGYLDGDFDEQDIAPSVLYED